MWLTKKGYQKTYGTGYANFPKKNDTNSDQHRVLQVSTKTKPGSASRERLRVSTPCCRQNIDF